MDDKDRLTQLEMRHGLLLDALTLIAKEQVVRETYGGLITLLSTGTAVLALKAIEKDASYGS